MIGLPNSCNGLLLVPIAGMRIFRFLADFRFLHGQFGHSRNLYRSAIKNVRGG